MVREHHEVLLWGTQVVPERSQELRQGNKADSEKIPGLTPSSVSCEGVPAKKERRQGGFRA